MGFLPTGQGPRIDKGLDDIYVKETRICLVDGKTGRLLYRGYDIRDLAAHSTFEETVYLLWYGRLPKREELEKFSAHLATNRDVPPDVLTVLKKLPKTMTPIDALRTAVSALSAYEPGLNDMSRDANLQKGLRLAAKIPTLVAAFHRIRNSQRIVKPNPKYSHATDYLRMLTGRKPDKMSARVLDVALVLHADHSMNAGSFAATVAASTLTDLYSCFVAAIATLKGPLHGGANETALKALLGIGAPDRADDYVAKTLEVGGRVFGFGHRVYRTWDPRALILQGYSRKLSERKGDMTVFEIAKAVEDAVLKRLQDRGIYPNVDYYAGVVYHLLGLPPDLFPTTFAVSRISGWVAHIIEYWEDSRIMRPLDWYVGPREAVYVPIGERG